MSSDRLAVISQRMAAVSLALIAAMLLLNAACWLYPQLLVRYGVIFNLNRVAAGLGHGIDAFPWWQKLGAMALSSVPLLALSAGLLHLRALFRCYARNDYFSAATAVHLGRVGRYVALWVALNLLFEPLLTFWTTMLEPPGQRVVEVSFGSSEVVALFLAASIAVIARILGRAGELEREHRQFI